MITDQAAWQRLAKLLVARRVELGYPNREEFARVKDQSQSRTFADMEKARRTNYRDATIALVEKCYGWQTGSIEAVLAGGDPRPVAPADDAPFVRHGGEPQRPAITDERLLEIIRRQRAELEELERGIRERSVDGT